jgi:hypothetical protein
MKSPYRVFVIVDPEFGERLMSLPKDEPAWIMKSETNTPALIRLLRERPSSNHLTGITTFDRNLELTPEEELMDLLWTIDLHHGEHSAKPPYSILQVNGCTPSADIRSALAEFGFGIESPSEDGFIAVRQNF